jgi:DNA-binding SARP family transcriptional activator
MSSAIRLLALGRIDVRAPDGDPIESILAQEKRLALLAYLTLATPRGRHRRDTLLGLFWPDLDQRRARAALRQLLHYLRRELGDDALVGSGTQEVGVDPDRVRSDVEEFEAALAAGRREDALDLYGGDLLKGFYVSGVSPEFEHWLDGERGRLRGLAEEAAWALTTEAAEAADKPAAVRWGRRALALSPYSESSLRKLLRLLNDLDAVAEALAVYSEFARQFHDVFEAQPSEKTRGLVEEIQGRLQPGAPAVMESTEERDEVPEVDEAPAADGADEAPPEPAPVAADTDDAVDPDADRVRAIEVAAEQTGLGRPWMWLGGVLAVLVFGLAAWGIWATTRVEPVRPDPDVVAVFPFEVEAADPAVTFLGEGLADLLAARVWGDAPLQALAPAELAERTPRAAGLGTAGASAAGERSEIARAAGAGRTIEGRVLGTPQALIISASVSRLGAETPEARVSVSGPLDSLPALVDRIAAALLIGSAGEDAAALAGTPLPALNSYLRGREAYRAGRYDQAIRLFRDALDQDSTFVHAAVGLASASRSLTGFGEHGALEAALEDQERLSTSERDFVDALVGSGLGQQPLASQLGAWERAVEAMPHQPDTWYWLGDLLFRHGRTMGLSGGRERALGVLERALEIDSTYVPALIRLIELGVAIGDRRRVDTLYERYVGLEPAPGYRAYVDWRVAEFRGRDERLDAIAASFPELPANTLLRILGVAQLDATGLDRADGAVDALLAQANPRPVQWASYHLLHHYFLNRGQPDDAARLTGLAGDLYPEATRHLQIRILDALYAAGDTAAAGRAADALQGALRDGATGTDALDALCVLHQWRLHTGETAGAREAIRRLEAGREDGETSGQPHRCASVLRLLLASAEGRRVDDERLDAIGRRQAAWVASWESPHVVNLVTARIYREQGNLPRALEVLGRRPYHYAQGVSYLSAFLREEARVARLLGDTAAARVAAEHLRALRATR